jgi:predicted ester cyclase
VPAEENKAIFRRYIEEVANQGNLELVDEIFERYLSHQPDGSTLERGPEDVKRFQAEFHESFQDFRLSIEHQITEGDEVVNRFTFRGTHLREFRSMAPTGKEVEVKGISIFRFSEEGKVVESWDSYYNQLSLMRQSIEQELQVARSIQHASLPEAVPALEGWEISPHYLPTLPASPRGGGRFLRLPGATQRTPWPRRGGRHRPWRACCPGDVHHRRHARGRSPLCGLAGRGT